MTQAKERSSDYTLILNFAQHFKPYKLLILLSLLSIPISTSGSIFFLHLFQVIIDDYIANKNISALIRYSIYLSITTLVVYVADAVYSYCFTCAGNMAIRDLRRKFFAKALRFPISYFDKHPIGITLSRLTSDMESLSETFATGLMGLLTDSIKTVALISYLFYLNWKLTLVVLLILPIIYFTIQFLRKKLRDAYNTTRKTIALSAAFLQEALNGMKTIQLYSAEKEAFQKYDGYNEEFCTAQNQSNVYDAAMYSFVEGITSLAMGFIIWFGANEVLKTHLTAGILIVFISTLNRLFIPIKQFSQQIATIQSSLSALQHIEELSETEEEEDLTEVNQNAIPEDFQLQSIVFKDVYFSYSPDGPDILKGISFSLEKGQRIALVGSTGSGKSTIIKILTKAYQGYRGSIQINGIELSEIPLNQVNRLFSVMQQDIYLFNDTIEFNIALGRENCTMEDVINAAQFTYANEFIEQLPEQYHSQVLYNGTNLSKGQAQLIAFARAICGDSELIILDEATSAVDSLTEQYIQKAIHNIFSKKTVIAIAHRLSTIKHSDLILVIDNGLIAEKGTHLELIDQQGIYASLVNESL